MTEDQEDAERDRLWNRTFDLIYDIHYYEIEVGAYIRRLGIVNTTALVGASLSGVTGAGAIAADLTIWKTVAGGIIGGLLLILAAVAAGLRKALDPAKEIPASQHLVADLTQLRDALEEFRSTMDADPKFDIAKATKCYKLLGTRSRKLVRRCPVNWLVSDGLRHKCQAETDRCVKPFLKQE